MFRMVIRHRTQSSSSGALLECGTRVPLWFTERKFGAGINDMNDISYIYLLNMPYIERYLFNSHDQATCVA